MTKKICMILAMVALVMTAGCAAQQEAMDTSMLDTKVDAAEAAAARAARDATTSQTAVGNAAAEADRAEAAADRAEAAAARAERAAAMAEKAFNMMQQK